MNSNQQTHQAMQGKYSNYQVSASQNNQLVSIYIYLLFIRLILKLQFDFLVIDATAENEYE